MGNLDGKVAFVTGGGSGIGEATAIAFAKEGARVAIADVNADSGSEVVSHIESLGSEAICIQTDVPKASEVEDAIKQVVGRFGRLDLAFNNAGIVRRGNVEGCEEADWDVVIDVNLKGVWLCMKYEVPSMVDTGGGAIVNMASVAGLLGFPDLMAYTASKHGVIGLTRAAALHCAPMRVRVNAVCPTFTKTAMYNPDHDGEAAMALRHPMGRVGVPEDVAAVVLNLCSDASSFVTGQALAIDGGYAIQ